jgi:hypothetical protein
MIVVNDNSQVSNVVSADSGNTNMLFVITSPRGRDRKIRTITGGLSQFLQEYGNGPFSLYGQPLLNAYAAFGTGAITGHVLRITADNSAYSYLNLMAKYKVDGVSKKMTVKFSTKVSETPLTDLDDLATLVTADPDVDTDGFTEVKLLSVAMQGRGIYGDSNRIRIGSFPSADKENIYKNYTFDVYENYSGLTQVESFNVTFVEDAIINSQNIFADSVVNDPRFGSQRVVLLTYPEGFKQIITAYQTANPASTLTVNDFDVLLGINKTTKAAIENYTVDTTTEGTIAVNAVEGIALGNGSDGDFGAAVLAATRTTAIEAAYVAAFSGVTDPMIKSKHKYPTNIILDANYSDDVKKLIAALATTRKDCIAVLDCGVEIKTKSAVATYVTTNLDSYVSNRLHMIDAYCGKVVDPYSQKIVTVTSTFQLATAYPLRFAANNYAKHVPLAGNTQGILTAFIEDSVYPVFDEDIDSDLMDELADMNVNFARLNAAQNIIRATQATRQDYKSNLSEGSNVFVLLDIQRDCEKLCANYNYNFNERSDIARFNKDVNAGIVPKYAEAQVRSIEAVFSANTFEAARGILHLNVGMIHRDLVKTAIIEIDVNRATV